MREVLDLGVDLNVQLEHLCWAVEMSSWWRQLQLPLVSKFKEMAKRYLSSMFPKSQLVVVVVVVVYRRVIYKG